MNMTDLCDRSSRLFNEWWDSVFSFRSIQFLVAQFIILIMDIVVMTDQLIQMNHFYQNRHRPFRVPSVSGFNLFTVTFVLPFISYDLIKKEALTHMDKHRQRFYCIKYALSFIEKRRTFAKSK